MDTGARSNRRSCAPGRGHDEITLNAMLQAVLTRRPTFIALSPSTISHVDLCVGVQRGRAVSSLYLDLSLLTPAAAGLGLWQPSSALCCWRWRRRRRRRRHRVEEGNEWRTNLISPDPDPPRVLLAFRDVSNGRHSAKRLMKSEFFRGWNKYCLTQPPSSQRVSHCSHYSR
jgi:hypothetical protein